MRTTVILAFCTALTVAAGAAAQQAVNEDAKILAALSKRINDYAALHEKLEETLPKLPKDATAQQVDTHQRALASLLQNARPNAKHEDIFGPNARHLIRRLLALALRGPDAPKLKEAIMEDNPGPVRIQVNGRVQDDLPRSTIPTQVLEMLPKLPEAVEYRFLGRQLVLIDAHALVVVDYVDDALPK